MSEKKAEPDWKDLADPALIQEIGLVSGGFHYAGPPGTQARIVNGVIEIRSSGHGDVVRFVARPQAE